MTIATQTPGRQWTVASETKPNTLYIVKLVDGAMTCDCPGGFHVGRCKHAKAVENRLIAEQDTKRTARVPDRSVGMAILMQKPPVP